MSHRKQFGIAGIMTVLIVALALTILAVHHRITYKTTTLHMSPSLTITRHNPLHQSAYPPLQPVTTTNQQRIGAIIKDLNHLSVMPSGIFCPLDDGVTYTLAFSDGEQATVDPSGCSRVLIKGSLKTYWLGQNSYGQDLQKQIEKAIHQKLRYGP